MNVHNRSIWPPPGAYNLNHLARARCPTRRIAAAAAAISLWFRVVHLPDDAASPVINRSNKE